ncbi:hypothetical protein FOPG_19836 [Fusarium oxysporum f. sp. conglutinans race 2 54008]|uniref:Uncharacterized protein n=1 Tax=Fusarium oxysporum f. sp. conglutinans race 2 54008 TaxID=1089457 RepID=X0GKR3_FUSOX|nr:hypothetical protein FOPG_19836 [Fusarium oxysporum f. sp. conglutinans race 2 54008]
MNRACRSGDGHVTFGEAASSSKRVLAQQEVQVLQQP